MSVWAIVEKDKNGKYQGTWGVFLSQDKLNQAMAALWIEDKTGRIFEPEEIHHHGILLTRISMENGDHEKKKNVSGIYEHQNTGRRVRFRLPGVRGRAPAGIPSELPPVNRAGWEQWIHIEGQPHPNDPRK
jgi:hypothetical protein